MILFGYWLLTLAIGVDGFQPNPMGYTKGVASVPMSSKRGGPTLFASMEDSGPNGILSRRMLFASGLITTGTFLLGDTPANASPAASGR